MARISLEIRGHVNLETASESPCFEGNYISEIPGLFVGVETRKKQYVTSLIALWGCSEARRTGLDGNFRKRKKKHEGTFGI